MPIKPYQARIRLIPQDAHLCPLLPMTVEPLECWCVLWDVCSPLVWRDCGEAGVTVLNCIADLHVELISLGILVHLGQVGVLGHPLTDIRVARQQERLLLVFCTIWSVFGVILVVKWIREELRVWLDRCPRKSVDRLYKIVFLVQPHHLERFLEQVFHELQHPRGKLIHLLPMIALDEWFVVNIPPYLGGSGDVVGELLVSLVET